MMGYGMQHGVPRHLARILDPSFRAFHLWTRDLNVSEPLDEAADQDVSL